MSRTPESVPLWGDALCLDFANSVDWRSTGEHFDPDKTDMLRTSDLLARWGRRLGLLPADAKPATAAELGRVRTLRESLYRVFAAVAGAQEPSAEDLEVLRRNFAEAAQEAELVRDGDAWRLEWPLTDPRKVRFAVVTDAVNLLRDPKRLTRVSGCPGRDCGWLFLNLSGRRRWCSMSTCGSREKMRRLHERRTRGAA